MARFTSSLDNVRVAAPCPADWDSMYGNERVRFCGECQLNVYNLSEMSRAEAERLIGQAEGRLCVRYYQRRDGSIITLNCPVGLRALKRRVSRIAAAISSVLFTFLAGIGAHSLASRLYLVGPSRTMGELPVAGQMVPVEQQPILLNIGDPPPNFEIVSGRLVPIRPTRTKHR